MTAGNWMAIPSRTLSFEFTVDERDRGNLRAFIENAYLDSKALDVWEEDGGMI